MDAQVHSIDFLKILFTSFCDLGDEQYALPVLVLRRSQMIQGRELLAKRHLRYRSGSR
jgi:hypothetical protein